MTMRLTGGPAFPDGSTNEWGHATDSGMTLRDYFAAKAMQGGIGLVIHMKQPTNQTVPETIAGFAYEYADAMLEARNK